MTVENTSIFYQYGVLINAGIAALVGFISAWVRIKLSEHRISTLETTEKDHIKKLNDLCIQVAELKGGLDRDRANWVSKQSPLALTDEGLQVLTDSLGKKYVDDNKIQLIDEIKGKNPKTAYDVQELSKEVIQSKKNEDKFIPIKDFAFKKGEKLEKIIDVLAIYLRDLALKELGFDISDIKD